MNSCVAAVVVLYQPDLKILDRLLASIKDQVGIIYVVDNTPGKNVDYDLPLIYGAAVSYQPLGDNYGIAKAHNVGIECAKKAGFSHVLLMDQDSELLPNTVSTLMSEEEKLLLAGIKVGAIGPVFVDEKTGQAAPALSPSFLGTKKTEIDLSSTAPVKTNYIIASGSLIRVSVLDEVGGMQDELFIDWVDIEWGERASAAGFPSFLSPLVTMRHSIGDESVKVFGREITLHSDFRNYFIVRNALYLALWGKIRTRTRFQFARKVPYYVVCYSWYSKKPHYAAKLLLSACWDGIIKNMDRGRL